MRFSNGKSKQRVKEMSIVSRKKYGNSKKKKKKKAKEMLEIKAIVRRIKSTSSFPSSTVVENPLPMQEIQRQGFDPWVRKVPWSRKGNLVQYSCLENSMERGTRLATVHGGHKELDTN